MPDFETIEADRAERRAHWRERGLYADFTYADAFRAGVSAHGDTRLTFHSHDVRTHFAASGIARQKTPEREVVVDDLPRTPSGKVRKVDLREQLRAEARATAPPDAGVRVVDI